MIEVGMKFSVKKEVTLNDTAKFFSSGSLQVFATPKMVALMEEASYKCVQKFLDEGTSTVGTSINVKHTSPTPVGMTVTVEAEVVSVEGRKICFFVKAYDECGPIGEGEHERFIINIEKFLEKACNKR